MLSLHWEWGEHQTLLYSTFHVVIYTGSGRGSDIIILDFPCCHLHWEWESIRPTLYSTFHHISTEWESIRPTLNSTFHVVIYTGDGRASNIIILDFPCCHLHWEWERIRPTLYLTFHHISTEWESIRPILYSTFHVVISTVSGRGSDQHLDFPCCKLHWKWERIRPTLCYLLAVKLLMKMGRSPRQFEDMWYVWNLCNTI